MASTVTLNQVIELAGKLSDDELGKLVKAVEARQRKRSAGLRRLDKEAEKARRDFRAGKLKPEPLGKALKRLHRMADSEP
jgi:hypothetical protein